MRKTLIVGGLALGLLVAGTGSADAAGTYTRGGDVLVTVACRAAAPIVTWPKDTTTTTCDSDGTYQHNIQPGNRFGAKITSHTGGSVACRVRDVESNRIIGEDSPVPDRPRTACTAPRAVRSSAAATTPPAAAGMGQQLAARPREPTRSP